MERKAKEAEELALTNSSAKKTKIKKEQRVYWYKFLTDLAF